MMKEMARMATLSDKERGQIQLLQEGLSGAKPMDLSWIEQMVGALKKNPKMFKTLIQGKGSMMGTVMYIGSLLILFLPLSFFCCKNIGGLTDEQTNSFIDTMSAMDASTLTLILRFIIYLSTLYKPAVDLYNTVDKYTFGCARYILLAIVGILLYYLSMVVWFVLRNLFVVGSFIAVRVYALVSPSGAGAAGSSADSAATVFEAAKGAAGQAAAAVGDADGAGFDF
jgi:hypothetical protein